MGHVTFAAALLADPTTPAAAIGELALLRHGMELQGQLVGHPNLPENHELQTAPHPLEVIQGAARSASTNRLVRVLRAAGTTTTQDFLSQAPDATPDQVAVLAEQSAPTSMRHRSAQIVATHPNSGARDRLTALEHLLQTKIARPEHGEVILAATHFPSELERLAALTHEPEIRETLRTYAVPGPTPPRQQWIDQVIASARRTDGPWTKALAQAPCREVALAAINANPSTALVTAIATSRDLGTEIRNDTLRAYASHAQHGQVNNALATVLKAHATPNDIVHSLALATHNQQGVWHHLPLHPHLDHTTLQVLWDSAHTQVRSHAANATQIHYLARCALHPAASAEMRAEGRRLVLEFGCSEGADRAPWFKASAVLDALANVDRYGFAGAGRRVLVSSFAAGAQEFSHLRAAGVRSLVAGLEDPLVARVALRLAGGFCGTLEELVATARTMAR